MNKKGEGEVAMLIIVAITVIVGVILFQAIASNVEQATQANTGVRHVDNVTYTMGALNVVTELAGQELVGTPLVTNETAQVPVATELYSIYECVRTSDNLKGICLKSYNVTRSVNITYNYYPSGYIDNAGARSLAGMIPIMFALAVLLIVLVPSVRNSMVDWMKG